LSLTSFFSDVRAVLKAAPIVERDRRRLGPAPLLARLRGEAKAFRERTPAERRRLGQIVSFVDFCMPGGGNCYRRALLQIAVDPQAADDVLRFGLRAHGGPQSGHAWLEGQPSGGRYDAEFSA
jgi:hypothetical protein